MARCMAKWMLILAAFFMVHKPCFALEADSGDSKWQTREMLVSRLGAQLYKIDILHRDLASIQIILDDLHNLELFPSEVTKLNESQLVAFDRKIEQFEKLHQELTGRVNSFRMPLADALAILREMIVGEPVEDMFKIIEKNDIQRLNQMLAIKHSIDTLWENLDTFLSSANAKLGFSNPDTRSGQKGQEEFFEIVRANLGKHWEGFFNHMEAIKDSLAYRAASPQRKRMFAYEYSHLQQIISEKQYQLAIRKVKRMQERYAPENRKKLNLLLAHAHFHLGEYNEVLKISSNTINPSSRSGDLLFITVKSLYELQKYNTIWEMREEINFGDFSGSQRNLLLWLIMESGLSLGMQEHFSSLARLMDKQAPYNFHVFHALARSYSYNDNHPIALSVFKSALRYSPQTPEDNSAYYRILLSIAQTQYETGNYEDALESFFELINEPEVFSEALFGIIWCYIKMEKYDKAETSIRKLINQQPQSPYAVEAILLMGKRFVNKAQFEWKKLSHLRQEEYRVALTLGNLKKAMSENGQASPKIRKAWSKLQNLLEQIRSEKRFEQQEIDSLYQKAQRACLLVTDFYKTGSFRQKSISQKRERILHTIDSLLTSVNKVNRAPNTLFEPSREKIRQVKELVRRSHVFSTEIAIEHYNWQKDLFDWQKEMLINEKTLLRLHRYSSQKSYSEKIKTIDRQIDTLVSKEKKELPILQNRLCERIRSVVDHIPLDTLEDIYLRYHLGELYYAQENQLFALAYERFEQEYQAYDSLLSLFHDGELEAMPLAPEKPTLDHQSSISSFTKILSRYPGHHATAPVEYSLAWCYNDLGSLDSAMAHMTALTTQFPQSTYTPQAWMYIGEYHFDRARLDSAAQAYKSVMLFPDSKWFDEALYKLAWTNYRLSNPEKAISSFLALIDMEGVSKLGKPLLEKESIDYIAISFSESDPNGDRGLKRAEHFVRKYGDEIRGPQILYRLAEVFREQGRYQMAKKTFNTLLAMYPHGDNNHHVENGLLAVSERDMSTNQTAKAKFGFFEKYNHKSAWAQAQKRGNIVEEADSMAAAQLYDAAILFHQLALQENDSTVYSSASKAYETFIHHYPHASQANECHYNFAEILFSIGEYYRASKEYIAVSKRYPDSKYRETAAWNAIVSSQLLMKQEEQRR